MRPLDCLDLYEDAEFYDLEFSDRSHEIPFFLKHALAAGGPVLEVACGTGRITMPIARAGVDITGLDVSAPMIEQARKNAGGLVIPWFVQDCRAIEMNRKYALIFSATNAMQHLQDLDSICAFLRSAREALAPGGTLILDVFNPDPAKLSRKRSTRYVHKRLLQPDGTEIRVEAASEYRADSQVLHFDLFYMRHEELLRAKRVNMRCFYPEELLALCRMNGLEVQRRFGSYDEQEFGGNSSKQILFCKSKN